MVNLHQPYRQNPLLRLSYSLIAPFYDLAIERPLLKARARSLRNLPAETPGRVLVSGIGTGLDLPLLPALHRYVALDFSAAMLSRARPRGAHLHIDWVLELQVISDMPLLAGGWFRGIVLRKIQK